MQRMDRTTNTKIKSIKHEDTMKQTIIKKVSTYLDHLNLKPLEFDESYSTRVQKICTVKKLMLVLEFRDLVGEYSLTTSIILEEYTLEFLESITHIFEFAWTENEFAALSIDEKKILLKLIRAADVLDFYKMKLPGEDNEK